MFILIQYKYSSDNTLSELAGRSPLYILSNDPELTGAQAACLPACLIKLGEVLLVLVFARQQRMKYLSN